jgi:hypothetical protein
MALGCFPAKVAEERLRIREGEHLRDGDVGLIPNDDQAEEPLSD